MAWISASYYGSRTQSQAAADAAALAGVTSYVLNPLAPQPATAQSEAIKVATYNKVMGSSITAGQVSAIASEDLVTHNKPQNPCGAIAPSQFYAIQTAASCFRSLDSP